MRLGRGGGPRRRPARRRRSRPFRRRPAPRPAAPARYARPRGGDATSGCCLGILARVADHLPVSLSLALSAFGIDGRGRVALAIFVEGGGAAGGIGRRFGARLHEVGRIVDHRGQVALIGAAEIVVRTCFRNSSCCGSEARDPPATGRRARRPPRSSDSSAGSSRAVRGSCGR